MSVLLHLSDTHFGTEQDDVALALLRLAHEVRPDIAVLSGDVTQRARRAQFAAARRFVDALAVPATLVIPGNHDIPLFNLAARVFHPYAGYRQAFGDDLEPDYDDGDLLIVGVNATRPRRHKDGEVSPAQIERVAQRLQAAKPAQLRVVAVHQPLRVELESERINLVHGHDHAARTWSMAGADLIISGHIHLPYVCPLGNALHHRQFPAWAVSAGTAVSARVRDNIPNSVNLIRYDAGNELRTCIVERLDYDANAAGFVMQKSTSLVLRPCHGQGKPD